MPRQFCVCNSHKSCTLAHRKFAVGQGINRQKTGNLKMQFEWIPCTLQYMLLLRSDKMKTNRLLTQVSSLSTEEVFFYSENVYLPTVLPLLKVRYSSS